MKKKDEIKEEPYMSFNRDSKFLTIGTDKGFLLYQTDPFKGPLERKFEGGIAAVEMSNSSNYLALIPKGQTPKNNNQVIIWDDQNNKELGQLKFNNQVISVKCSKNFLFVICLTRIYMYNINTLKFLDSVTTVKNPNGLFAISGDKGYLNYAYPHKLAETGIIIINRKIKKAFSFPEFIHGASKMEMNYDGTLLITANQIATKFRVRSCFDGTILQKFYRKHQGTLVYSISLDQESHFMAFRTARDTIYLFSVEPSINKLKEQGHIKENKEEKKDEIKPEEDLNVFNSREIPVTNVKPEEEDKNEEKEEEIKEEKKEDKNEVVISDNSKNKYSSIGNIFGSKSVTEFKLQQKKSIIRFIKSDLLAVATSDYKLYLYQIEIDLNKKKNDDKVKAILKEERDLLTGKQLK